MEVFPRLVIALLSGDGDYAVVRFVCFCILRCMYLQRVLGLRLRLEIWSLYSFIKLWYTVHPTIFNIDWCTSADCGIVCSHCGWMSMYKNHNGCSICFYTICAHSASVLHADFQLKWIWLLSGFVAESQNAINCDSRLAHRASSSPSCDLPAHKHVYFLLKPMFRILIYFDSPT